MSKKAITISSSPRKGGDSGIPVKIISRPGKFSPSDVERLDRLRTVLFRCFEPFSVAASTKSPKRPGNRAGRAPFSEESINEWPLRRQVMPGKL